MSRTKKKKEVGHDNKQILAVMQTLLRDWKKTGISYGITNLIPRRNGMGIILDETWQCTKCGNFIFKEYQSDMVCRGCKGDRQ